jgi:hypothetical protein
VVPTLSVVRKEKSSNVFAKKDSSVIHWLVADLNVSLTPTAPSKKLAEITNARTHVKVLVEEILFVKSSITIQFAIAHRIILVTLLSLVMSSESHQLYQWTLAIHHLAAPIADAWFRQMSLSAHVCPNTRELLHSASLNVSSAVNAHSTRLATIRDALIHVQELVALTQIVLFSTITRLAVAQVAWVEIHSPPVTNLMSLNLLLVRIVIHAIQLHVAKTQSVRSGKTGLSALALKISSENRLIADPNVFWVQNVLKTRLA